MNLAERTQNRSVRGHDIRAASRMEGRIFGVGHICRVGDSRLGKQRVAHSLQRVEISVAEESDHDLTALLRQFCRIGVGNIDLRQLIQRGLFGVIIVIPCQHLQHRRDRGRAHYAGILAEGIGYDDGFAARVVGGHIYLIIIFGADEREGLALIKSHRAEGVGAEQLKALNRRPASRGDRSDKAGRLDGIIAVNAENLLGDIVHAAAVGAEGGYGQSVAVHLEFELAQHILHIIGADVQSEEGVDAVGLELHRIGLFSAAVNVNSSVHDVSGAQQSYKLAGTVERGQSVLGVESLFKASRAFGAHTLTLGGHADRASEEVRALEYDGSGIILNFAVCSAHDSGKGDRLLFIGDNEILRVEDMIGIVERFEAFAILGGADDDLLAVEAGIIKGVHGLTIFQHDIVGDVNDVVDRSDSGGAQTHSQPQGRGSDSDIFNYAGGVARAKL